jgi:ubiquinone/menaquinone biosynthesis C-methylase UbiE
MTGFTNPEGYDGYMGRWSRRLAPVFLQFSGAGGGRLLDLGAGTGALSEAVAAAGRASEVVAFDPVEQFVAHLRDKTGHSHLRVAVGDAQHLPFAAQSFEACLSLLVIHFIPDATQAAREMLRVTRPGGVVATCAWDFRGGMELMTVFWSAARALDPEAGQRDSRRFPFGHQGDLTRLWRDAGFKDVAEDSLTIPLEFTSFDDFWQPFEAGATPTTRYVASLPKDHRVRLRERLRADLLGDGPDRPIALKARAWAVRGLAPGS